VCRADDHTTFMYQLSRNSGSLNLLEPKVPVQACSGISLLSVSQKVSSSANVLCVGIMRDVRKVKNVCAYNLRSCFVVPDQSCGVFSHCVYT